VNKNTTSSLTIPPSRIEVTAAAGAYPVVIGQGTIASLPQRLDQLAPNGRRILVSSPLIWDLHQGAFGKLNVKDPILVPDGERFKNLATVMRVYEGLIQRDADRATVVIAVGGGVIGDLVGFAAATYLRGVRLVHVPTTLLAQVDSAVGGKVGVNHTLGKNLIGAFHPPILVVADTQVLTTLPRREFRAGLYEVIKYGVIASESLLDRVASSLTSLFDREQEAMNAIVTESCRIKAGIVSGDERESGIRRVLNFGHTLGHAFEAVTKYRRYRHGEAIAYGMLAALALGVQRGITPKDAEQRVARLVGQLGPLPPVADLSAKELIAAVRHDKKVVAGTLHFIAATGIGATTELKDVSEKELKATLQAIGITRA
jgi:3-dehydroquinate synthase